MPGTHPRTGPGAGPGAPGGTGPGAPGGSGPGAPGGGGPGGAGGAGPPRCPPWSGTGEAARLFLAGVTARAAAPIAVVVGTILSAVNEGGALLAGRLDAALAVKVAVNYVVPFVVASLGYLTAGRVPPEEPAPGAGAPHRRRRDRAR